MKKNVFKLSFLLSITLINTSCSFVTYQNIDITDKINTVSIGVADVLPDTAPSYYYKTSMYELSGTDKENAITNLSPLAKQKYRSNEKGGVNGKSGQKIYSAYYYVVKFTLKDEGKYILLLRKKPGDVSYLNATDAFQSIEFEADDEGYYDSKWYYEDNTDETSKTFDDTFTTIFESVPENSFTIVEKNSLTSI